MAVARADTYNAQSGTAVWAGRPSRFAGGDVGVDIWGQSNAIARGDQSDLTSITSLANDPDLALYMNGTKSFDRAFMWTGSSYDLLTASNNGADVGQFGPEFGMAIRWHRETSSGRVYFTKEAISGAPIGTTFGAGDPTYGYIYNGMKTRKLAARAWLAARGITLTRDHWLWIQGEADYLQTQAYYYGKLTTLMSYRSADGLIDAVSRMVLAKMKVGSLVWAQAIDDAKDQVIATDPSRIKTCRMDYYKTPGDAHQNGRGVVQTAYDAFELFFDRPHIAA